MRYPSIPSSLFTDRRKDFAKKMVSASVAIFCSNDPMPRSGDQFFPFRQDSALFALSGLDQPGTIIVLNPDAKKKSNREIAFILPPDPEHLIWHGERYSQKQATAVSGISTIYTIDQWDRIMPSLVRSASTIYTLPRHTDWSETEVKTQNDRMNEKLKQLYPKHTFQSANAILTRMLMLKHPVEIDLMRNAVQVTGRAFDSVLHHIRPGMFEYEVEARLTFEISRHGCQYAFEPIVASGGSACTLHYVRNDKRIGRRDLVLIDFGAEYACMASDMTRTIPASGTFTKRQRAIYTSVLNVLNEITTMMRPGVTLDELNREAGVLIERELVRLKIISNRDLRRQDAASPLRRKYFMHGIGHHLGYDVHDVSDRRAPLKPGMVITCEPGLYILEEQIGIRLENDILITRGKPKNLMADIPIEPEEIEALMNA
ncbi:MAG: aminopeptidase P family protein [Saprospiraceae bacterium]|nr:aminopeptidase P family protein [Saprospiraceae bacterium]